MPRNGTQVTIEGGSDLKGRKPVPTALRVLRGNPGKRRLPKHEPKMPPAVQAPPPAELTDPIARAYWLEHEPLLRQSRTITRADHGALVALCQQWARYQDAFAKSAGDSMTTTAPSGYQMTSPYIGIADRALRQVVKLMAELGLTPSARSRVTTANDAPHAGLEAFLHEA